MKRILTAIDGSKASYRALELAAKLAKGLGAELKILLVRQFVVGRHDVPEVWSDEEVRERCGVAGRPVRQALHESRSSGVVATSREKSASDGS